jgi:hypothetical protein
MDPILRAFVADQAEYKSRSGTLSFVAIDPIRRRGLEITELGGLLAPEQLRWPLWRNYLARTGCWTQIAV